MELKKYDGKPQFIEELVFRIAPGQVARYLDLEAELFSEPLAHRTGFLGGETWVSADHEGEVTSLYFWESEEAYHSLDQVWLGGQKQKMGELMGDDAVFVRAGHTTDRRFRVREFR
ncbi:antibiotic biosynthesis monooxygenase [Pseudoflavonifractor sp. MSJ-37]|uniref:antibiotic biosynthesis monooxygenase n=1 Tax=Pseudoflavonifractor sp. MSJ-37 TaxID=2841531 RepID=UPI001C11B7AF|nr:antibiotic biosynthesis monooxygenase [Pseudoflavonifractor sp. MSJ-37]MBU5434146.1 antibiotic biosynthesis monooxygenase [Pseudoflavonifractor sp. MSJ-37]